MTCVRWGALSDARAQPPLPNARADGAEHRSLDHQIVDRVIVGGVIVDRGIVERVIVTA